MMVKTIPLLCLFLLVYCPEKTSAMPPSTLYQQIMTPMWIKTHASYIDPTNTVSSSYLSFLTSTAHDKPVLFKVQLLLPGMELDSTPLSAELTVAMDQTKGSTTDSDVLFLLCDGDGICYGISTVDKGNYAGHAPCFGTQVVIANNVFTNEVRGPQAHDSSLYSYPAEFVIRFRLQERWVSCLASVQKGGFSRSHVVSQQLKPSKGLSLVVAKTNKGEKLAIGMVKMTLIKEI